MTMTTTMKLRGLACGFVTGGAVALGGYALSQDMEPPGPEAMQEMMAKAMEIMKPGAGHERLDAFVGEFDVTVKTWMGGPGTPATTSRGTCTNRWVLDGRFVHSEAEYEMMWFDETGAMKPTAIKGMGLTGYDNWRKVYVGTWADNLNTHLLSFKGGCDPAGKVFTYYGEMDEPMLGVSGRLVKYETRLVDRSTHVMSIYDLHVGDDYKVLEFEYRRRGGE